MAAHDSTVQEDLPIPLIDFAPFLATRSPTTAASILSGFRTSGFIYLSSHGIPTSLLSQCFTHSRSFFARPLPEKEALSWTTPEANRGYVRYGREKNSQSLSKAEVERDRSLAMDLKESMEIGPERGEFANQWPRDAEGAEFRKVMLEFMARADQLHLDVMSAIAVGLGLGERFFEGRCSPGANNLRLLHYPPVGKEVFVQNPKQVRLGAHSDYGSVTLLFQDAVGGLQVEHPAVPGRFVDVRPIEGTVVINAGDLLARWANDTIRSTLHRVVEPDRSLEKTVRLGEKGDGGREGEEYYPARYAVVYFCAPNFEEVIETLPGTWETEEDKVYKTGIKCKDHLVQRLAATY